MASNDANARVRGPAEARELARGFIRRHAESRDLAVAEHWRTPHYGVYSIANGCGTVLDVHLQFKDGRQQIGIAYPGETLVDGLPHHHIARKGSISRRSYRIPLGVLRHPELERFIRDYLALLDRHAVPLIDEVKEAFPEWAGMDDEDLLVVELEGSFLAIEVLGDRRDAITRVIPVHYVDRNENGAISTRHAELDREREETVLGLRDLPETAALRVASLGDAAPSVD